MRFLIKDMTDDSRNALCSESWILTQILDGCKRRHNNIYFLFGR